MPKRKYSGFWSPSESRSPSQHTSSISDVDSDIDIDIESSDNNSALSFRSKRSPPDDFTNSGLSLDSKSRFFDDNIEDVLRGKKKERGKLSDEECFIDEKDIPQMKASSVLTMLNDELWNFVRENTLNADEIEARNKMIELIVSMMRKTWPDAQCVVFGSYGMDLAYSEADIDMSIIIKKTNYESASSIIEKMERKFLKKPKLFGAIKSIPGARVPIVKGIFLPCGIHFDISTATESKTLESGINYIKRLKNNFPLLHPLSIIIKQMLKQRNLNQPFTGGMGGYCTVILIASFLKSRQMRCPYTSRDTDKVRMMGTTNLAVALLEFLELYGSLFNYRDVTIDVRNKTVFLPKSKMVCEVSSMLSVIDPTSPTEDMRDIGGAYFKWETIRDAFAWVGTILSLPYMKIMSINSCNIKPGNTILERVMSTTTFAPRIKELCKMYKDGISVMDGANDSKNTTIPTSNPSPNHEKDISIVSSTNNTTESIAQAKGLINRTYNTKWSDSDELSETGDVIQNSDDFVYELTDNNSSNSNSRGEPSGLSVEDASGPGQ